jgi:peptidyl-prolyl cis-trans isomerase SurA
MQRQLRATNVWQFVGHHPRIGPVLGIRTIGMFLLGCVLVCRDLKADFDVSNGIAAIVNDSIITVQDVRREAADTIDLYQRTYFDKPDVLEQKRVGALTEALERLIDKQLILDDFKTLGGMIRESYIDDAIRDRVKERFGDRVTLTKSLMAQKITSETFRLRMRNEIIQQIMEQKNVGEVLLVSPAKIERYYQTNLTRFKLGDQIKLRMIEINRPAAGSVEDTFRLIHEIKTKIGAGTSFGEMATSYSEDLYRKEGGLWGWVGEQKLLRGLSEIAFNLPVKECSPIVCRAEAGSDIYWVYQYDNAGKVTIARKFTEPNVFLEEKKFPKGAGLEDLPAFPQSFYLMYVDEKQSARTRPLEEVRDEIEKDLLVQERARLQRKWLQRLRAKAFVSYLP